MVVKENRGISVEFNLEVLAEMPVNNPLKNYSDAEILAEFTRRDLKLSGEER